LNDNISNIKPQKEIKIEKEKTIIRSKNITIEELEEKMYLAVEELDFKKAAEYRDAIQKLKKQITNK
jgi:excinuclease UvrABC nuclease subunit